MMPLAAAAAAATAVFVGSTIVATRFVLGETSPVSLALMRYLIGFCCLLPAALRSGVVRCAQRDLLPVGLLGIVQFGVVVVLLNYALQQIPSARAALIFATSPLLTMLLAAATGVERVSRAKGLGVIITVVGVGLVLGEGALQAGGSARPWLGDLAAFGSALSAAACNVLYRPYLRKYSVLPVSAFAMLASVLFLALLAAGEGFFGALPRLSPGGWWAVGFIGVSSGIGYYLWLWALSHTTPTNATVYLALSPATAAGLGALLLGEHTSPTFLIGLAGSGLGLWLARLGDEESPVESGHGRRWWRSGA